MARYIAIGLVLVLSTVFSFAQDNTLEVSVSDPQPYLGELFTYSISFISTLDLTEAQLELPQFVGFAQQPQSRNLSTQTINGITYNVLRQNITLYSNRVGDTIINPATIIVPDTPFQTGLQVQSNTVSISTRSLPANPPATFNQAVGQFDITVSLNPTIIQAGEPNQLSIAITGSGNFDQITSLSLPIPSTWEVFDSPPTLTNTSSGLQTKTFRYQIFPDQTGDISLPTIEFTFFDPTTETYKIVNSDETSITVQGEFTIQSRESRTPDNTSSLALKPMTSRPATIIPTTSFWILWTIPPIFIVVIIALQFVTRPRQQDQHSSRKQSRALKSAITQLTQAQQLAPNQIYDTVEQTIIQYISDSYRVEVGATEQLRGIISDLPVNLQQRILACLQQAQSGQYAPITPDDANKLLKRTYKTLHLVEEERS